MPSEILNKDTEPILENNSTSIIHHPIKITSTHILHIDEHKVYQLLEFCSLMTCTSQWINPMQGVVSRVHSELCSKFILIEDLPLHDAAKFWNNITKNKL